eukprot:407432_1
MSAHTQQEQKTDKDTFEYKASYNTGIYGSYIYQTTSLFEQKSTIKPSKYGKLNGVSVLLEWNVNNKCKFCICKGSVVSFIGDAIVNAANERCIGGGYVDHAIAKAAGKKLKQFRLELPIIENTKDKRCLTGSAVITKSGIGSNNCSLKCKYVIHAVGPNYKVRSKHITVKQCHKLLYNTYAKCMLIGKQYKLQSIGFCLISAGIFRGTQSLKKVLKIACQSIYDHIFDGCKEIYLIGYTQDEINALKRVGPLVFGTPNIIYSKKIKKKLKGSKI